MSAYKLAAKNSRSTVKVIAKTGEEYPTRVRFRDVLKMTKGSPKFYKWEVSTGQVRRDNIAVAIQNPKGEPGFLQFWLNLY